LIRSRAGVVWLQASPETLHARIEADAVTLGRRPNLTLHGGLTEIAMLLAKREPWYRSVPRSSSTRTLRRPTSPP